MHSHEHTLTQTHTHTNTHSHKHTPTQTHLAAVIFLLAASCHCGGLLCMCCNETLPPIFCCSGLHTGSPPKHTHMHSHMHSHTNSHMNSQPIHHEFTTNSQPIHHEFTLTIQHKTATNPPRIHHRSTTKPPQIQHGATEHTTVEYITYVVIVIPSTTTKNWGTRNFYGKKPNQNGFVERFLPTKKDECLGLCFVPYFVFYYNNFGYVAIVFFHIKAQALIFLAIIKAIILVTLVLDE